MLYMSAKYSMLHLVLVWSIPPCWGTMWGWNSHATFLCHRTEGNWCGFHFYNCEQVDWVLHRSWFRVVPSTLFHFPQQYKPCCLGDLWLSGEDCVVCFHSLCLWMQHSVFSHLLSFQERGRALLSLRALIVPLEKVSLLEMARVLEVGPAVVMLHFPVISLFQRFIEWRSKFSHWCSDIKDTFPVF